MILARYPITWIRGILNQTECWLGVCAKTRGLYHIENRGGLNGLALFVVEDVIINEQGCEEAKRCLCQRCPLNRTTPASYWKGHGLPGPPPKNDKGTFSDFLLPDDLEPKGGFITAQDGGPILELTTEKPLRERGR